MASTLSQSFQNLPANDTEMSALRELLDSDLELRSFILRRQEGVQARCSYAKKAAEGFANCLATTSAVKGAYAASMLSVKTLEETLKHALNLYNDHKEILATIPSTRGILVTWAEIMALTETMLAHLDKAATQVQTHLHLATSEQAAHESAHIAASESMRSCADSLQAVDRSIAQKRVALSGIRIAPTEILLRIFMEAVDARQCEIINSLSSHCNGGSSSHDLSILVTTLNLVPFTISATCKRWRAICRSTPRLWRYARVPTIASSDHGSRIIGKTQFEQCVLLAQKQPLELTIYPCNVGSSPHNCTTTPNLVLSEESQTFRVNIVWERDCVTPRDVPSPTKLCIVASGSSSFPYIATLPTELLANTKELRWEELTLQISESVGVQSLHIHFSRRRTLPSFHILLQNYPQLKDLHLEVNVRETFGGSSPFTHQQLHTLYLTAFALPWVIRAFSSGVCLPRLVRLVLTDINGLTSVSIRDIPQTNGQLSHITHIEVQAVSAPGRLTLFRQLLFDLTTALRTLTLAGGAVEPILNLLASSVPKRVQELILCDSEANGTKLRNYLVAIEQDGGGTAGMEVVWKNCPRFSDEYGTAFGELHL